MFLMKALLFVFLFHLVKGSCPQEEEDPASCCKCQDDSPESTRFSCRLPCPHGYYEADISLHSCYFDNAETETLSSFNTVTESGTNSSDPAPAPSSSSATTPPVTVPCMKCDPACAGCRGPGPHNCTVCATGFQFAMLTSEREGVKKCFSLASQDDSVSDPVFRILYGSVGGVCLLGLAAVLISFCIRRRQKLHGISLLSTVDEASTNVPAWQVDHSLMLPFAYSRNGSSRSGNIIYGTLGRGTQSIKESRPTVSTTSKGDSDVHSLAASPLDVINKSLSSCESLSSQVGTEVSPDETKDLGAGVYVNSTTQDDSTASTVNSLTPPEHAVALDVYDVAYGNEKRENSPDMLYDNRSNTRATYNKRNYANYRPDDAVSVNSNTASTDSSGFVSNAGVSGSSTPSAQSTTTSNDDNYSLFGTTKPLSVWPGETLTINDDNDSLFGMSKPLSVGPGSLNLLDSYSFSSSTQTLTNYNDPPSPFVSESWHYSKELTYNGGLVQKDHSDVLLQVPQIAIERGDSVMIHQAVSVDLQAASTKLPVPDSEVIVSPVAEFYAGEGFRFRKPVCIVLPHLLPAGVTERDIHVNQFSCDESGQPQLVKFQYRNIDSVTGGIVGTYCFGEGSTVHIFVDHFSGVFCTKCKADCYLPDLWLELYGQYSDISELKAEVGLVLKIWDTDIEDFKQDDPDKDSLYLSKMKKIDGKRLPALEICGDSDPMREVESTDLSVRLALPSHELLEWMHETRDDGQNGEHHAYPPEESFRLKKLVLCDKHKAKRCQRKDWSLVNRTGVTPVDVFTCFVDAGYVRTDGAHANTSRHYIQTPKKITFKVRLSPDSPGHNAGDSARGVTKETDCGSRGQGHDGPNVTSHETQRKFAAGDPDETLRKKVCQAESYQRAPVSFGSTKTVNIVLQTSSHECTGYSNTQSHTGREHLSDRSPICVLPSTSSSLSTPSPGHHGPVLSTAQEQSSSENAQTSPNDSSAATGNGNRRLTLTGLPCEPDSSSLPSSTMSSVV